MLTFEGGAKDVTKVRRLVKYALSSNRESAAKSEPLKNMKCDSEDCCADVDSIINGDKLSDLEIKFAQKLLKQQFPALNGLQCTLFQSKPQICKPLQLQVIHCSTRDHWIVASNCMCMDGELNVYDCVLLSRRRNE